MRWCWGLCCSEGLHAAVTGTLSLCRGMEGQAVYRHSCSFGTAVVALRVYIAITGTVGVINGPG